MFLGETLFVYIGGWLDFLKRKLYQLQLQSGLGQMHFWCLIIKVDIFALDEDAVLWPETTCLDGLVGGWLAGFSGNIAISAWQYKHI